MKKTFRSRVSDSREAFTLTELIVVIAVLALLGLLVLPTFAGSRSHSANAGCLANLRRLQIVADFYRNDNGDSLLPNSPLGFNSGWLGSVGVESWAATSANTNVAAYANTIIGRYLTNSLAALRCPGDVVPSQNGLRVRSYSMNGQMGYNGPSNPNPNPTYRRYLKGSDLTCPTPANAFVFADESPLSLNDGYFQLSLATPSFFDIPAAYLEGACGFSFADGHGEIHRWQTTVLAIPVTQGATASSVAASGSNADWLWLRQRSACLQP